MNSIKSWFGAFSRLVSISLFFVAAHFYMFDYSYHSWLDAIMACKASPSNPKHNVTKILFAVVSMGHQKNRQDVVRKNIEHAQKTLDRTKYRLDCQVFFYAAYEHVPEWMKDHPMCRLRLFYKTNFVHMLKLLDPQLIADAGYSHVHLLMEDVALYPPLARFDFTAFYDQARQFHLVVASPTVINTVWGPMKPQFPWSAGKHGRFVNAIEIQSTLYRVDAWACLYDVIDTEYPSGWGLDLWFYPYCVDGKRIHNGRMGVLDSFAANHLEYGSLNQASDTMSPHELYQKQRAEWKTRRNIDLKFAYFDQLGKF